jgi:hypothetical protein
VTGQFRVYADKPELRNEIVDGKLKSYRTEQYTLIPQGSGELTLPEISVVWWDTATEERREARVPARSLEILPALSSPAVATRDVAPVEENQPEPRETLALLYALIGGLAVLLALLIRMQRRMTQLSSKTQQRKRRLDDLNPT